MDFCKQFNARTQDKAGKVLPVVITYYNDKSFSFVVKTPPVAIQLLEAAKKKSGSAAPNRNKIAEITWDQVKAIAEDECRLELLHSRRKLQCVWWQVLPAVWVVTVKGDFPGK